MQLRRKVNRVLGSAGLKDVPYNNRIMSAVESEGRMVIPRFLVAFQRNNIRLESNTARKVSHSKLGFAAKICKASERTLRKTGEEPWQPAKWRLEVVRSNWKRKHCSLPTQRNDTLCSSSESSDC